jgi:hypothetical protein
MSHRLIYKNRVNNFIVTPLKLPVDNRPVKGAFMFDKAYGALYAVGKKESGKTVLLWNIIRERCGKDTILVLYVSTIYNDPMWIEILNELEKMKIQVMIYTSIYDDDGNNTLGDLVDQLKLEAKARFDEERKKKLDKKLKIKKKPKIPVLDTDEQEEEEEKKKRKEKELSAEYIIIIDDLSDEIKDNSITTLIKKHRHFRSFLILSNQYLNDVSVSARKNVNYYILFRDIEEKKMEELYKQCGLRVTFEEFYKMYKDATNDPDKQWSFFYFDKNKVDFRQDFNEQYEPENIIKPIKQNQKQKRKK